MNLAQSVPFLQSLPATLSCQGAIDIELDQGALLFRVSQSSQHRIEELLEKQKTAQLTDAEALELDQYEDIDDYLSYLNRLTRNLALVKS